MTETVAAPSGILIIDKPQDWTSHDVVAKVRRILKTKKVGHAGTLDPMATGVLIVLVGKATKLSDKLLNQHKTYAAEVSFGQQTDTGDAEGEVIKEEMAHSKRLAEDDIKGAALKLIGDRQQQVPAYSAVKVDGKKLYELARKGQELVNRPSRTITIESIGIDAFKAFDLAGPAKATITVECSKGTYIRVLAEELAEQLGTVGHLTALRRLKSGDFAIEQAVTLDRLLGVLEPESLLIPIDDWL